MQYPTALEDCPYVFFALDMCILVVKTWERRAQQKMF